MEPTHDRRRIDRILSPDYLHGLDEQSPAALRALRDECRDVESELSYTRRVLQARIDIARTEAARRAGDENEEALLERLPGILADGPQTEPRAARAVGVHVPEQVGRRAGEPDSPEATLTQLPDLSDGELADLIGRLSEQEQRISHQRRVVLDCIDRLQAELVRRYRDGDLAIGDVVTRGGEGEAPDDA